MENTGSRFDYPNEWPEEEGVLVKYDEDELVKMKKEWPKSSEHGVYLEPVGSHETNPFDPPYVPTPEPPPVEGDE